MAELPSAYEHARSGAVYGVEGRRCMHGWVAFAGGRSVQLRGLWLAGEGEHSCCVTVSVREANQGSWVLTPQEAHETRRETLRQNGRLCTCEAPETEGQEERP